MHLGEGALIAGLVTALVVVLKVIERMLDRKNPTLGKIAGAVEKLSDTVNNLSMQLIQHQHDQRRISKALDRLASSLNDLHSDTKVLRALADREDRRPTQ